MIIMINGPFGVGKTSISSILKNKIKDSLIYDPEEIGFMLRNIVTEDVKLPEEKTGDFQDIRLWRDLTVDVADRLTKTYNRNLIIPMTIRNVDYFTYIYEGLKNLDKNIHHYCLLAQPTTISNRLIKRGDDIGSWAFQQTEKCLNSFESHMDIFQKAIYTDDITEMQVCQIILDDISYN